MPREKLPYKLLKPGVYPSRDTIRVNLWETPPPLSELNPWLTGLPTAIDFETTGTRLYLPTTKVVGVGLAGESGRCYVDVRNSPEWYYSFIHLLYEKQIPLIAHNLFFDGMILTRDLNAPGMVNLPAYFTDWKFHNFHSCTYYLAKDLANEGWLGQEWGLKALAEQLLGWEETQEKDLKRWLVENGVTKKNLSRALAAKLGISTKKPMGDNEDDEGTNLDNSGPMFASDGDCDGGECPF
jgi:hypothetical protein